MRSENNVDKVIRETLAGISQVLPGQLCEALADYSSYSYYVDADKYTASKLLSSR